MKILLKGMILPALLLHVSAMQGMPQANRVTHGVVITGFAVVVGFPDAAKTGSGGTVLVPGTVIPLVSEGESSGDAVRRDAAVRSLSFNTAVEKLWNTFRLDPGRQLQRSEPSVAITDTPFTLRVPEGVDVKINAELVRFDDRTATYRIVFRQGEALLADSTVDVTRGGRAVVGGMDGASAPYIFVFIEPETPGGDPPQKAHVRDEGGVISPVITRRVNPVYPPSAREEKIRGNVVLELLIGADGEIRDVKVIDSPDARLTEAAVTSVRQWEFQPARLQGGGPVAAYLTLTIRFWLK